MKKNYQFCTIFDKAKNVHLIKDVGQIPYLMFHLFDYESILITHEEQQNFTYIDDEVKGLNVVKLSKIRFERYSLSILWYLYRYAKAIDILHLFHHREKSYVYGWMYKWRNPKGILYLKSDMGLDSVLENHGLFPPKKMKYRLRYWLFDRVKSMIDIISIENRHALGLLQKYYPQEKEKLFYLPNGVNTERMYALARPRRFDEKANLILCVGRIGALEKNHEMLLEAIQKMDLTSWKVVFIGPIDSRFDNTLESFWAKCPDLRDKVFFTGAIEDRAVLFDWYSRSKILCSTSDKESFGLVMIEAMAYANVVVTTPVASAQEITSNQSSGLIIETTLELVERLTFLMENETVSEAMGRKALEHVKNEYEWKHLLTRLEHKISKCHTALSAK